jgi:hypothetical protein
MRGGLDVKLSEARSREITLQRLLLIVTTLALIVGPVYAQSPTGTLIIYRPHGASVGLIHYSQGEHPTIICDGDKVAKMRENRKTTISVQVGTHVCEADQQQPGTLDASSEPVSVDVKPNTTTYLRLGIRFGHLHFVLREVSSDIASAEIKKMRPVKDKDSYTSVLPPSKEKQLSRPGR